MGAGMASNIVKGGFDLTVWNRTASKMDALVALGAKPASSPKEAGEGADAVVTSLMDDKSILEILHGDNGILAGMKPGSIHVCVTTISPTFADELLEIHQKHGTKYVQAPVLGRPDAAADGSLIALLAGDSTNIEIVKPVIETFTKMVDVIGEVPSHAATMKLCMNYCVVSTIEIMSEVYTCADKAGLNLDKLEGYLQVLFGNPILQMYATKIKKRDFDDGGFRLAGGLKDVRLMLAAAESLGSSFDIGKVIEEKMVAAITDGMEDKDWSAVYEVSRKRAQIS